MYRRYNDSLRVQILASGEQDVFLDSDSFLSKPTLLDERFGDLRLET